MGSKTPFPSSAVRETPSEDAGWSAACPDTRAGLLLRGIAEALRIPQAALYNLPNAAGPMGPAGADADDDLEDTCAALLRAYRSIPDPDERRRLLALVQRAAERT